MKIKNLAVVCFISVYFTRCEHYTKKNMLKNEDVSKPSKLCTLIDNVISIIEKAYPDMDKNEINSLKSENQIELNQKEEINEKEDKIDREAKNETIRSYYYDTYLDKIEAKIIKKGEDNLGFYLITDRTIFHPQGGGQPSDEGGFSYNGKNFIITKLVEEKDYIKHYSNTSQDYVQVGDKIELKINLEKRKLYAKLHSSGHIIASIVENKYSNLSGTKGNHFPNKAAVVFTRNDIDGSIQKNDYKTFDNQEIKKYLESSIAEHLKKENKTLIFNNEETRKVKIGDLNCYPCGGTHVKDIKDIKNIIIKKVKFKSKEGIKISYEVKKKNHIKHSISKCIFHMQFIFLCLKKP